MAGKGERLRDNFVVKEADDGPIKNHRKKRNLVLRWPESENFVANCGAEFSSENQPIAVPDCGSDLPKITFSVCSIQLFESTIFFETMKSNRENRTRSRCRNPDSLHIQRDRANKRERERTKALNAAYIELRRKIPSLPSDKTSKIHTLRVTVEYIQFLRELIYNQNGVLNRMDFAVHDDNQINLQATFNSWRTNHNQHWSAGMSKQSSSQRRSVEVSDRRKSKMPDSFAATKSTGSNDLYSTTNVDYSKLNAICQHAEMTNSQVSLHHPIEKPKSEFDLTVNLNSQYADQVVQPFSNSDCHSASTLSYALSYAINHTHL
ncbi:Protein twist [Aphelenchoides besseyi]|nr:Protein twist [Aphelenchoides besseyi]